MSSIVFSLFNCENEKKKTFVFYILKSTTLLKYLSPIFEMDSQTDEGIHTESSTTTLCSSLNHSGDEIPYIKSGDLQKGYSYRILKMTRSLTGYGIAVCCKLLKEDTNERCKYNINL